MFLLHNRIGAERIKGLTKKDEKILLMEIGNLVELW